MDWAILGDGHQVGAVVCERPMREDWKLANSQTSHGGIHLH
jgi:hypothetical protein